jgi:uncharacterized protein (DUF305 family)
MTRIRSGAAAAALLVAAGLLAGCDGPGSDGAAANGSSRAAESRASSAPTTPATMSTPKPAPSPTGKPARGRHNKADVAFANGFVIHHAQGIEMARTLLANTDIDPAVRTLATRIIPEQSPQIERLRAWLAGWGRPVPAPNGSPTSSTSRTVGRDPSSLSGMMSADDMAALGRLDGVEGAKLFLAMLVNHELGAIQMAYLELAVGRNGEAMRLARTIVDEQQARVSAANELLDGRIHPPGNF